MYKFVVLFFKGVVMPYTLKFLPWITRKIVREHPDKIFLFGDNLEHRGYGGQASEMRGEPNAIGIPTKKSPRMQSEDFFTDKEYEDNIRAIDKAFSCIPESIEFIIIPKAGLGTGLALLEKYAPRTFLYLRKKIQNLGKNPGMNFHKIKKVSK